MTQLTPEQLLISEQLELARQEIKTDAYPISISEIISNFKDGEIVLDPAFQRLFRWDDFQKTKLIESILIGIPIPEIFVAQKPDGTWHVVDGVQRLSTIFQLVGVLDGKDPLTMTTCKYIPSLEGKKWSDLNIITQREFRKSKIKFNIISTQSSDEAQYELFQRLNTGGTHLEDQEVRNCLILMLSPEFYELINSLKNYPNFKNCLKLNDSNFEKEFHMELIIRMFIGYANITNFAEHGPLSNILLNEFLDKETINIIKNYPFSNFENVFKRTFDKLSNCLGKEVFLKYSNEKDAFYGAFNVSMFELVTTGVSTNIDEIENIGNDELTQKIKNIASEPKANELLAHGTKALKRFKGLTEFSREYFKCN